MGDVEVVLLEQFCSFFDDLLAAGADVGVLSEKFRMSFLGEVLIPQFKGEFFFSQVGFIQLFFLGLDFLFDFGGGRGACVGDLLTEVGAGGGGGDDLLGGEEVFENVLVFGKDEFDESVGAGGGVEEAFVIAHATLFDAGGLQGFFVFADVAGEVVVEVVAEELQDAGFADAVVVEHAGDFALDVFFAAHAAVDDGLAEDGVGLEVAEGVIDGESEFPVLQFGASVGVGFDSFGELGPEEGVAVEEDGGEAHEKSFFFSELGDGVFDKGEVAVAFRGGGRLEGEHLEEVGDGFAEALVGEVGFGIFEEMVDGCEGAGDLGVVSDGGGEAADIAGGFDALIAGAVVSDLRGGSDEAEGAVGHVFENVVSFGEDLGGLGAVDGGEVGVVVEAVFACGGKDDGDAFDGGGVGNSAAFPVGDAVDAEVEFKFAAVVGGNGVAVCAEAGFGGVVFRLGVDELIEAGDVLGGSDAPDAFGRGSGFEFEAFGERAEEEVVVDKVGLGGIAMRVEAAFVGHRFFEILNDPVGEAEALDDLGLLLLFGRHFLERDLGPDGFPKVGVGLIGRAEFHQVEVGFRIGVVVAFEAMELEEIQADGVKAAGHDLAGDVGPGGL